MHIWTSAFFFIVSRRCHIVTELGAQCEHFVWEISTRTIFPLSEKTVGYTEDEWTVQWTDDSLVFPDCSHVEKSSWCCVTGKSDAKLWVTLNVCSAREAQLFKPTPAPWLRKMKNTCTPFFVLQARASFSLSCCVEKASVIIRVWKQPRPLSSPFFLLPWWNCKDV